MSVTDPSRPGLAYEMARALDASASFAALLCRPPRAKGWCVEEATPGFWRAIGRAPMPPSALAIDALLAGGVGGDLLHALDERRELTGELPFAAPDGRRLWFGVNLVPAASGSAVLFGRDVTTQRAERLERRASEALLAAVFLRVDAAVTIVDARSNLLMANPPMESLFGFPPGRILGRITLDLIAPADRAAIVSARDRQLEDGTPYTLPITCLRHDGSPFPVIWSSRVAQSKDHSRFRIVTVRPTEDAPAPTVLVAGKIQLIGLEAVRASLGDRWAAMAERVMATAEHVLRGRLGASDTFSRTTDSGFVVCFHGITEEAAGFRAATIAREIRTRLLGTETEAGAAVSVVVAEENAGALPHALEQRLEARRRALEGKARALLAQATAGLRCEAHKVMSRSGKPSNLVFLALPADLRRRLLAAASTLPPAEAPPLSALSLTAAVERAGEEMLRGSREHFIVELGSDLLLTRGREAMLAVAHRVEPRLARRLILLLPPEPPALLSEVVRDLRASGFDPAWLIEELPLPQGHPAGQQRSLVAADAAMLMRSLHGADGLAGLLSTLRRNGGIVWARDVRDRETSNELCLFGVGLVSLGGPTR